MRRTSVRTAQHTWQLAHPPRIACKRYIVASSCCMPRAVCIVQHRASERAASRVRRAASCVVSWVVRCTLCVSCCVQGVRRSAACCVRLHMCCFIVPSRPLHLAADSSLRPLAPFISLPLRPFTLSPPSSRCRWATDAWRLMHILSSTRQEELVTWRRRLLLFTRSKASKRRGAGGSCGGRARTPSVLAQLALALALACRGWGAPSQRALL